MNSYVSNNKHLNVFPEKLSDNKITRRDSGIADYMFWI